MRGLPFFKGKKGPQFAGMNFSNDASGGGGGGGYTLPTATASRLGGVKIGSGINVSEDGTISASGGGGGGGGYNISTTEANTGMKLNGSDIYVKIFPVNSTCSAFTALAIPNSTGITPIKGILYGSSSADSLPSYYPCLRLFYDNGVMVYGLGLKYRDYSDTISVTSAILYYTKNS